MAVLRAFRLSFVSSPLKQGCMVDPALGGCSEMLYSEAFAMQ